MKRKRVLRLVFRGSSRAGVCAYRLLDDQDRELKWVNEFLEYQHVRGLSPRSLRAYGFDLLHFARWWTRADLSALNEARLFDYVRYQLEQNPQPTPQTINHRLTVLHCLYRFRYQHDIPGAARYLKHTYTTRSPLGYGKPARVAAGLRVKQPRRVVVPLSSQQVAQFWHSFRTFRDLALIALMLLDGLRSREVIEKSKIRMPLAFKKLVIPCA